MFLSLDHDGGGGNVLHAVQTEDLSQVGKQHQCWRLQLQLILTPNGALRRYVSSPAGLLGLLKEVYLL